VLGVLWRADRSLTPGEVREQLGGDLAYTTVMTILGRLLDKGLASRRPEGRAYAYRAAISEAELTARRMGAVLDAAQDRTAALTGFVGTLSKRDAAALRRAIDWADR
jgi:predicted transcriptional regulator